MRPGKRLKVGDRVRFGERGDRACLLGALDADRQGQGRGAARSPWASTSRGPLWTPPSPAPAMPLPPYIASRRPEDDARPGRLPDDLRREDGSVAAPTAGLHFTPALLAALEGRGVAPHRVTLHVGAGTFLPVKADDTRDHHMHAE